MPVLFPNIHHCRQTWPQKSYGLTAKTSTAVMPAGTVQIGRTNLDISGNDSALHNEMSKVLQAPTLHFFWTLAQFHCATKSRSHHRQSSFSLASHPLSQSRLFPSSSSFPSSPSHTIVRIWKSSLQCSFPTTYTHCQDTHCQVLFIFLVLFLFFSSLHGQVRVLLGGMRVRVRQQARKIAKPPAAMAMFYAKHLKFHAVFMPHLVNKKRSAILLQSVSRHVLD